MKCSAWEIQDFPRCRASRNQIWGKRALKPLDLIRAALILAQASKGKPRQAVLRRAVSTAYYAVFHCLALSCADLLVGGSSATRKSQAWRQAYRALDHGSARKACERKEIDMFPLVIQNFARAFIDLQGKRHMADYDPQEFYYKSSVGFDIAKALMAITDFETATTKDRRAFAVFVLFRQRTP